jgi:UDP-N-acetyl-D-galactosamine dehydrogenase
LPVAVAFARQGPVIGFDINEQRVASLKAGIDSTGEVAPEQLRNANLYLTSNTTDLKRADFHVVAVPTPIDRDRRPDLAALLAATETVGRQLKHGDVVVFESTVYPGVTEEECVPILERCSGLEVVRDFAVAYSPERINPGDREHNLADVVKVVSACDGATLDIVARVYSSIVKAGVYRAPSIRVAEAAKVIENTQRDLNIALVNELALIFQRLDIDTRDVLAAASTKWNFLHFEPGLVGGHCIGVDPYYLTHRAERAGYHPEVVLAGRRINDNMGRYIANECIRLLMTRGISECGVVTVLGLTFKENVPDVRNSRVPDIVRELKRFNLAVSVYDPIASLDDGHGALDLKLSSLEELAPADAVVLAVSHTIFRREGWGLVQRLLAKGRGIVLDVKGILDRNNTPEGILHWRL